jgi:hypothetical protein
MMMMLLLPRLHGEDLVHGLLILTMTMTVVMKMKTQPSSLSSSV